MLDLSALERAIVKLREVLLAHAADPANEFVRDAAVQRFEYTYDLSVKFLRRQLQAISEDPEAVRSMEFRALVREGIAGGYLAQGVAAWAQFRDLRARTSHTYQEAAANSVVAVAPALLAEAETLYESIRRSPSGAPDARGVGDRP